MCTINPKPIEQLRDEDEVKRLFPRGADIVVSPSVRELYEMLDERNKHDAASGYHRTT